MSTVTVEDRVPYNIDHTECLKLDAWMYSADVQRIKATKELPEDNFLEDFTAAQLTQEKVTLTQLNWRSEFSGTSYHSYFVDEVAPLIHGEVDVVFVWEGGDSTTGLRIRDGKVEETDVTYTLVQKKL